MITQQQLNFSFPASIVYLLDQCTDQNYGCVDGSVSLSCCLTRYSHIEWQVSSVEEYSMYDMWQPLVLGTNSSCYLDNSNQTLIIKHLNQDHNHKYYKCIGYEVKGHQFIEKVFKVNVQGNFNCADY